MASVTIKIETDSGTELEITERDSLRRVGGHDLDNVPALLGAAVKRAVHAVAANGDRQNAISAVAERMGVVVEDVR